MEAEVAVCRAQAVISCALQDADVGVRAALPFDPDDREDVRIWLRQKLSARQGRSYSGSVSSVTRSLVWEAKDEKRRATRRTYRSLRGITRIDGLPIEQLPSRIQEPAEWSDALEWFATLVATTALGLTSASANPRRSADAILSCLGRTVAHVLSETNAQFAREFANRLCAHPSFVLLPLGRGKRQTFRSAIARLRDTGSRRRDLSAAGIHWPSNVQWHEFKSALQAESERTVRHGRQPQVELLNR